MRSVRGALVLSGDGAEPWFATITKVAPCVAIYATNSPSPKGIAAA